MFGLHSSMLQGLVAKIISFRLRQHVKKGQISFQLRKVILGKICVAQIPSFVAQISLEID